MDKNTNVDNDNNKIIELVLDLEAWISDNAFEPPFPYNVLWKYEGKKSERLKALAKAAHLAYINEINKENKKL